MTSLPLTKQNLKQFMNAYAKKMEAKSQGPRSEVSFASSKRSKSQGSNRSRSKPKFRRAQHAKAVRGNRARLIKEKAIKTISPVVKTIENQTKRLSLAKSGYFSDSKDVKADIPGMQKELDQLIKELQLAVGAIRAGLGNKPIRMRLSAEVTITTTVTSGVTNSIDLAQTGSNQLNPTRCGEWATCAALFEEYKCLGGHFDIIYTNSVHAQAALTNASNSLPVIAYDADDGTAATSSMLLTQAAQHKVLNPVLYHSTSNTVAVPDCGAKHHFKWRVPRGSVVENASGVADPGTNWIPVADVVAAGYVKFYHVGSITTAIFTGTGVCYFDLEFRCRA